MSQLGHPSRRRDKPVLSCTFCRTRKIGCDRRSPCSACIRRGKPAECTYSTSAQERQDAIDYRPRVRGQQARQRITRLENLVTELRDRAKSSDAPLDSKLHIRHSGDSYPQPSVTPSIQGSEEIGKLSTTDDHEIYTGGSHWATILEDIQGLKNEFIETSTDSNTSRELTPFDFDSSSSRSLQTTRISLLTSASCLTKEQILAMIPPRKVVDRLVSHFFNTFDFATVILHKRKFLAEYASFWANKFAAPIMWIGLLLGVMSMSAHLQSQDAEAFGLATAESENMLETCRTLTIHCLNSGNYLQPSKYTIEALLLHFAVDQNVNVDTYIGNWVLIGVVVRIALRIGLHRDPSHWPNIRPMQAELRRRIWLALYQMDYFTSTQVGLPRIIKDSQCDARLPAHLLDDDITFEHNELPPERPLTDPTPLSFIIHRHSIIKVAAEIYDATDVGPPSPETISVLTSKIETALGSIPSWLKAQSPETSIADSPVTLLNRMFLDILVQKALYTLHRQNFVRKDKTSANDSSKATCIDAALAILGHLQRIPEETQPGGMMFSIRWKVVSSLTHEFLQATMMLCFALSWKKCASEIGDNDNLHRRYEILEALKLAKGFWERNSERSTEAKRAVNVISTVLGQDSNLNQNGPIRSMEEIIYNVPNGTEGFGDDLEYQQRVALDPSLFTGEPYFRDVEDLFGEFVNF